MTNRDHQVSLQVPLGLAATAIPQAPDAGLALEGRGNGPELERGTIGAVGLGERDALLLRRPTQVKANPPEGAIVLGCNEVSALLPQSARPATGQTGSQPRALADRLSKPAVDDLAGGENSCMSWGRCNDTLVAAAVNNRDNCETAVETHARDCTRQ